MKTKVYRAAPLLGHVTDNINLLSIKRNTTLSLQAYLIALITPTYDDTSAAGGGLPCVLWRKSDRRRRRRARLRTSGKGSLTVEAVFILPFFFLICMALFCFSGVYAAQTEMTVRLEAEAEKAAMYSCGYGALPGEDAWREPALAAIRSGTVGWTASQLKDNPWADSLGLSGSVVDDEKISLVASYGFSPWVSFPGLGKWMMRAAAEVYPWTGDTGVWESGDSEELVYVSNNREAYHTHGDCSYLDIHIQEISRVGADSARNIAGDRYSPCDKCCRGAGTTDSVYVTGRGRHYHSTLSCSGLSRSVRLVPRSEVPDLPLCSRCSRRQK
ncbi:MAG TPA: hypothetical protein DF613_11620 [Lachnospiraceae bacterium]|nr:hypothetical protein [Lachnospiraceae bacterium]